MGNSKERLWNQRVEPARLLTAQEVAERVCGYLGYTHDPPLSIPDQES
jgi:hypothetical protein